MYDYLEQSPYITGQAPEGEITPYYEPLGLDDTTLLFESRFESANLRRVIQLSEFEYDLILKTDYNSKRNCQWYYFQVSNTRAGQTYYFNIINLEKPDSLYNQGMRPLMYSERNATKKGLGWVRTGDDICYYQSALKRPTGVGYFHTLTWKCTFEHDRDTVYLAHSHPYTYTDLQRYLNALENGGARKEIM